MITHLLCGQAVLREVKPDIAQIINKHRKLYNIGAQGPDVFFYRPRGATAGLGLRMHGENVGKFLNGMSVGLEGLASEDREAAFAYFAGFLTHYALDCAAHPYVYYKTGFDSGGKLTGRYKIYHTTFESAIDTLLLKHLQGCRPIDKKWWRSLAQERQSAQGAATLVTQAVNAAYDNKLEDRHVLLSMGRMALATRILRSRWGLWRGIVGFVENLISGDPVFAAMIHRQEIGDDIDYLNYGKNEWKEPWDEDSSRHDSFRELFNKAATDALKMINALWSYMQGEMSLGRLQSLLGDRSFNSGRPISEGVIFKVHDIVFKR